MEYERNKQGYFKLTEEIIKEATSSLRYINEFIAEMKEEESIAMPGEDIHHNLSRGLGELAESLDSILDPLTRLRTLNNSNGTKYMQGRRGVDTLTTSLMHSVIALEELNKDPEG